MKVYILLLPFILLSCYKSSESTTASKQNTEQQCFILNEGINYDDAVKPTPPPTHEEILKNLPAHIKMTDLTDFQKFTYDLKTTEALQATEKKYFDSPDIRKNLKNGLQSYRNLITYRSKKIMLWPKINMDCGLLKKIILISNLTF